MASVLCFIFLAWGMWDLSSPTRDWTLTPCIGKWSLTHWTAREVTKNTFKKKKKFFFFFFFFLPSCVSAFPVLGRIFPKYSLTFWPLQVIMVSQPLRENWYISGFVYFKNHPSGSWLTNSHREHYCILQQRDCDTPGHLLGPPLTI